MNERIQELMVELKKTVSTHRGDAVLIGYDEIEKFAELIVRNCGYHADVFSALGCPVDMDPTETKPSDYIKREMGITE